MAEYTPSEGDARAAYKQGMKHVPGTDYDETSAEFDRFLARVRRDAAEEVRQYIKRLHRKGLTSQDAVLADIEIAADRLGRGIHANGRDRETP